MSRITGSEARSLMEAYNAVYAPQEPQELTEEQIWESAEIWVYECIENGVDFSEYTLDELTEAFLIDYGYLSEDSAGRAGRDFGAGARQLFGQARRAVGGAIANTVSGAADVAGATLQGYGGTRTTSSNPLARAGNFATRAATAPARFALRAAQGFVTGQGSTPSSRPAAQPSRQQPPARPAATTPARPGAPANTATPKGQPTTAPRPGTQAAGPESIKPKTSNPMLRDNKIADMIAASKARQAGQNVTSTDIAAKRQASSTLPVKPVTAPQAVAATTKPVASEVKATNTAAAAPKPITPNPSASQPLAKDASGNAITLNKKQQALPNRPEGDLFNSVDLFDIVKGHLLDEGYADTNEAALAIMANMSEEWRESIVEELEQLDEISLKTKIRAAARRGTDDFESGEDATTKSGKSKFDKTLSHIEKRHGAGAARHAVAATNANTFGRTDKRTGKRQERPQSRTQRPNQYRTRADGKMHGQDQAKLKRKLQNRRPSDSDN